MTVLRLHCSAALLSVALLAGCGDPVAPDAREPLTVLVDHRGLASEDRLPSVRVTVRPRGVGVEIERLSLCATLVDAHVARGRHELAVVTRVRSHPAAICPANMEMVVDYSVTVEGVDAGTWIVRVFEAVGEGRPKFLREARVRVSAGV